MKFAKWFVLVQEIANKFTDNTSTKENKDKTQVNFDFPVKAQLSLVELEQLLASDTVFGVQLVSFFLDKLTCNV